MSVNPDNPQSFSIRWDQIENSRVTAQRSAEQMAAAMRGEGADPSGLGALGRLAGAGQAAQKWRILGDD